MKLKVACFISRRHTESLACAPRSPGLAAKKCFKLNNNLPQELELHFVLDLVLVPQVVLASHLLDQLLGHQHAVLALGGLHCGVRVEHLGAILFKGINEFSRPNA